MVTQRTFNKRAKSHEKLKSKKRSTKPASTPAPSVTAPTPLLTGWQLSAAQQSGSFISKLPLEIRLAILELVDQESIRSCLRSCQELHSYIKGNEAALARRAIDFNITRLQTKVDRINSISKPTDAISVLDGLKVWTETRGRFGDLSVSSGSLKKWISHLCGGGSLAQNSEIDRWTWLAVVTVKLQGTVNHHRARNIQPEISYLSGFEALIQGIQPPPLDSREIAKLVRLVSATGGNARYVQGPSMRGGIAESETFPSEMRGLHCLTPSIVDLHLHQPVKQPRYPAQQLCANLGLPALPGYTFCYYINESAAYNELSKGISQGPRVLTDNTKADILECVEIF